MTVSADLDRRYQQAFEALPANVAPLLDNNAIDGNWIDDRRFFFCADQAGNGTIPMLADLDDGLVRQVITQPELVRLTGPFDTVDARYAMPSRDRLAVATERAAWLIDLEARNVLRRIALPAKAAVYSPDGTQACILAGHDLALLDLASGAARQITSGGQPDFPYGQMPQTSQAPISYARRPYPVALWSADGAWLATHRVDERHLAEQTLVEHAPANGGAPRFHRYRFAEAASAELPMVTTVAIELATGRTIESRPEPMHMFAPMTCRGAWFADGMLLRTRTDRYHRRLALVGLDLANGAERELAWETCEAGYLEPHPIVATAPNVRYLRNRDEVIWWSERDGWGHLYLLEAGSARVKRQITSGPWQVRDIVHLDVAARTMLIAAGGLDRSDPVLRTLVRVSLDHEAIEVLATPDGVDLGVRAEWSGSGQADRPDAAVAGWVSAAPDGRAVVLRRSSPTDGSRTVLRDLRNGAELEIAACPPDPAHQTIPRWCDVLAADGETRLKAALYLPDDASEAAALPLIDLIYPGPQSSTLSRAYWSRGADQARALNRLGFAALITDSRGLPLRSRAFHQCGYGDLVEPQLTDHVAVIEQLCERFPVLDKRRVGILGSSAGGYASAIATMRYPETFRAGVAVCGTDDPARYFAGWLEKYVGPDCDGSWARQVTGREAASLRSPLMIVHGDMDENVHPFHAMSLARRLVAAGKTFEQLIVPNQGHLVQGTSAYAQRRIWDFFVRHLLERTPPTEVALEYPPENLVSLSRAFGREALWS